MRDVWNSFGPCLCSQTGEVQNNLFSPGGWPASSSVASYVITMMRKRSMDVYFTVTLLIKFTSSVYPRAHWGFECY